LGEPKTEEKTRPGPLRRVESAIGAYARKHHWARKVLQYGAAFGSLALILTGFLPIPEGWATWVANATRITAGLITLAGIAAANDRIAQEKTQEEIREEGFQEGLRNWRLNSSRKAGALGILFRHFAMTIGSGERAADDPTGAAAEGEKAIIALLQAIVPIVEVQYKASPTETMVNLMIPVRLSRKRKALKIVAFAVEVDGRATGRELSIDPKHPSPGAVAAYCTGQPQYIYDTYEVEGMDQTRPYRSIMSWPIKIANGDVLGVVNVDSVNPGAFGPADNSGRRYREAGRLLCSDLLAAIGIALLDRRCFSCNDTRI